MNDIVIDELKLLLKVLVGLILVAFTFSLFATILAVIGHHLADNFHNIHIVISLGSLMLNLFVLGICGIYYLVVEISLKNRGYKSSTNRFPIIEICTNLLMGALKVSLLLGLKPFLFTLIGFLPKSIGEDDFTKTFFNILNSPFANTIFVIYLLVFIIPEVYTLFLLISHLSKEIIKKVNDRRSHDRLLFFEEVPCKLSLYLEGLEEKYYCSSRDLSAGGVGLMYNITTPCNCPFNILMEFKPEKNKFKDLDQRDRKYVLKGKAYCVHGTQNEKSCNYLWGLKFSEETRAAKKRNHKRFKLFMKEGLIE